MLRRAWFLLHDLVSPQLKTIGRYKLDVLDGDKDAHNLISPIWLKRRLQAAGFEIVRLTSYALYFKPKPIVGLAVRALNVLPLTKYAGGRIVLTARKR